MSLLFALLHGRQAASTKHWSGSAMPIVEPDEPEGLLAYGGDAIEYGSEEMSYA